MNHRSRFLIGLLVAGMVPTAAGANERSATLRARAYASVYNLDYQEGERLMDEAAAADPADIAAERGRAVLPWLLISFRRGAVTVDEFLGSVSGQNVAMRAPPQDLAARFQEHIAKAARMAEAAVAASPGSADAHYQLGAVAGLQATYIATVEGRVTGSLGAARRAFNSHERVLKLDPLRQDAGLVPGTYRYFIASLSLPMRMLAYAAGFGGGKERGIRMIEHAAGAASEAQTEARLALVLMYNREERYADALRMLQVLQQQYPRNRLLWLEAGATALRAGDANRAIGLLTEGWQRLERDARPRMFGEEALWLHKRGAARVSLNRLDDAERDLRRALTLEVRDWVAGRTHAELGKILDLRGDRRSARAEFTQALTLAERDRDARGAATARRWINVAYTSR